MLCIYIYPALILTNLVIFLYIVLLPIVTYVYISLCFTQYKNVSKLHNSSCRETIVQRLQVLFNLCSNYYSHKTYRIEHMVEMTIHSTYIFVSDIFHREPLRETALRNS